MALRLKNGNYIKIISTDTNFELNTNFIKYRVYESTEDRENEKTLPVIDLENFMLSLKNYEQNLRTNLIDSVCNSLNKTEHELENTSEETILSLLTEEQLNTYQHLQEIQHDLDIINMRKSQPFKNLSKLKELGLDIDWLKPVVIKGEEIINVGPLDRIDLPSLYSILKERFTDHTDC